MAIRCFGLRSDRDGYSLFWPPIGSGWLFVFLIPDESGKSVKTEDPVRSGMSVKTEEPVGSGMAIIPNEVRERLSSPGCLLYKSLCHHGLGNLDEAGNIGTLNIVHIAIGLGSILNTYRVNLVHDVVQLCINLLGTPL